MTGSEYQKQAMRTNDGKSVIRLADMIVFGDKAGIDVAGILMGCLGLAGESGELLDALKKWIFHEKPFTADHLKKELGDVCWYLALICHCFGWNLDEIFQMNIDKLKARYPAGFDADRANHRAEGDI